ncbi:MAG: hypothetical protein K0R40_960 [Burkholderiales bacterium]|jgi:hypothetical protein|nr:hypothetical protein [Burkholderiales bacterium]
MTFSKVDLPMPDSPITAMYSPAASSRETPLSTLRAPKCLVTPLSFSTPASYLRFPQALLRLNKSRF